MELIERGPQLRKLADAWNQVRAGKGCLALVSGEAGIGKTSLIERFVGGQRKLARVLWGTCDDLFSPQPLGPFFDIALQLPADLLQLIQSGADRLAISTQLFIHLQKSLTPVIVVLEDLHWADEATLDVVKFLGRRVQHTKTLLILSYRDDEVNSQHPLHFLLGDFPPHLITRIPVSVLSEEAVQHLAQKAGRPLEDLYATTGGNPFFVSEVIADDSKGIPTSVRDAVLARIARLSPAAKNIVELAALMPGAADIWLLEEILHPHPAALDECVERGILHAEGDNVAFRHELARQAVEGSIPIGRIRELHGKILKALLSRNVEPAAQARLVHHATCAGDEEATLRYAPTAARQASALGAHREAASLYKTSLSLTRRLPAEAHAELLEGLSFENYLLGDVQGAIQAREQAILIWEGLERYERAGDCKRWLSRLHWSAGNRKEAERYADQAIEILRNYPVSSELAMALSTKSQLHMLAGETEPAIAWGQQAIELAEKLGATEIFVHALTNVGTAEDMNNEQAGKEKLERALRIARENEMHDHVARCYTNLATVSVRFRRYPEAERWLREGLEYTTARDVDIYSVYLRGWQAQMYFETGQWAKAEEQAAEVLRSSQSVMTSPIPALTALGHMKARQGDAEVTALLDRARFLAFSTTELQRIGPVSAARAEAAWWCGAPGEVITEASPGYELALSRNDPWTLGQLAYWMWRAGERNIPVERLAPPYALMIRGEWQTAAQAWERIGCPFERALALAEGDPAAKREALLIFERLGARPAAAELRKKLQAQGLKNIPRKLRSRGQEQRVGLTAREVEVLRLMAEGLSNLAIAEKLTISEGTVKAHTASIYNKLGVNNRVQALARAGALHLL